MGDGAVHVLPRVCFSLRAQTEGVVDRAVQPGPPVPAPMIRVNDAEQAIYGFLLPQRHINQTNIDNRPGEKIEGQAFIRSSRTGDLVLTCHPFKVLLKSASGVRK